MSIQFQFHYNLPTITGTLQADRYTVLIISRPILFKTRNASENFVQKIKTHILCSVIYFSEKRAVYEIMWENIVDWGRPQMAIWGMRFARWIPEATNTHSKNVTTYCSSTKIRVNPTEQNITFFVHYLSCLLLSLTISNLVFITQTKYILLNKKLFQIKI
jgi:hypothetical protein